MAWFVSWLFYYYIMLFPVLNFGDSQMSAHLKEFI